MRCATMLSKTAALAATTLALLLAGCNRDGASHNAGAAQTPASVASAASPASDAR